ncbi:MAG: hypothetical protein ACLULK_06075 [Anaerovoracaceae bacterium]
MAVLDNALQQLLKMSIEVKLLWKNASPASKFPAQKILIDLDGYDFYMIENNAWTDALWKTCGVAECGGIMSVINYITLENRASIMARTATHTSDGLIVSGARYFNDLANSSSDSGCIPIKIYGIKIIGGGYSLTHKIKDLFSKFGRRCFIWQY